MDERVAHNGQVDGSNPSSSITPLQLNRRTKMSETSTSVMDNLVILVKEIVIDSQGCKVNKLVSDLVIKYLEKYGPSENNIPYVESVEEAVKRGEIVEIEYILPNINYRIKSFLLPTDSIINVRDEMNKISLFEGFKMT